MKRRPLVAEAVRRLADAGVASPEADAEILLAHVLEIDRSRLVLVDEVADGDRATYDALVGRRAAREPLQHLTGRAYFRHVELAVGPGVFVPRPETELLAGWAVDRAGGLDAPVVVDLGTGSGAIAKAVADEVPHARVHAVELDEAAHGWATTNLAGTGVDLRLGDLGTAFDELAGTVDVVVSNPPYIPLDAGSRSPSRSATTTRPWRSGAAPTAWTRCAWWRPAPPCCSGPGEWSGSSTPTPRASPRPRSSGHRTVGRCPRPP